MPLLVYCTMEAGSGLEKPCAGVGGRELEELQDSGLRCFFSRLESRDQIASFPAVESALAFHHVLQALFRQAALIAFRFPTVVENEEELRGYLREHAPQQTEALSRLRHMVQMEIHIGQKGEGGAAMQSASGSEYLGAKRARIAELEATAAKFRQTTRPWVADWRERQTGDEMRCYALCHREAIGGFQSAAQALSQSLPATRLSGPWPPAEFIGIKAS